MRKIVRIRKVLKGLGACGAEEKCWEEAGRPETADEWIDWLNSCPRIYSSQDVYRFSLLHFLRGKGLKRTLPGARDGAPLFTGELKDQILAFIEKKSDELGLTEHI